MSAHASVGTAMHGMRIARSSPAVGSWRSITFAYALVELGGRHLVGLARASRATRGTCSRIRWLALPQVLLARRGVRPGSTLDGLARAEVDRRSW